MATTNELALSAMKSNAISQDIMLEDLEDHDDVYG